MSSARYRIVRTIGRGGMAEVLEAIAIGDNGFERRVALKRLLGEHAGDQELLAAFIDEARIASRLHHEGIVAVIDSGLIDELPFIATELVEGLDLSQIEALGVALPLELALYVTTEIAHALDYAHNAKDAEGRRMGIVHRDVSPENIMVSVQGGVKLADFGIALAKHRLAATRIGFAKGKPSYMAPEQIEMRDVDHRADIYSLGVVLERIAVEPDAVVSAIIEQATMRDRKDRFQSAAEMAAECGRAMTWRLESDPRSAMRGFMDTIVEPETEAKMRKGADLIDVMLVLDGPMRRYASRALLPTDPPPLETTELTSTELLDPRRVERTVLIDTPTSRSGLYAALVALAVAGCALIGIAIARTVEEAPEQQIEIAPAIDSPHVEAVARGADVEPQPSVEPEPEVAVAPRPAKRPPRADDTSRALAAILRDRGLSVSDLEPSPDPAILVERARAFAIDERFLKAELARAKSAIERRAKSADRSEIDRLERSYFELRAALRSNLDEKEACELLKTIRRLVRDASDRN